jgi:hypothetical protein
MQAIRFQLSNCHPDYKPKAPMKEDTAPITRIELFDADEHPNFKMPDPIIVTDLNPKEKPLG